MVSELLSNVVMVIFLELEMEDFSSCQAGEKRAKYGDCSRLVSHHHQLLSSHLSYSS